MAVSSPCLTTSLPSLSANSRLNSSFVGGAARVQLADNVGTLFNCRTGETSRIRAELDGAPSIETSSKKVAWRGVPTKLNTTPHSREIRQYFYKDVCQATKSAISDGKHKLRVLVTIPELNPEMDVYRIGTLLELIREVAFVFADDGKRVRVCVQGAMGEGIFRGMPLALAGTRPMLERMDWGTYIDEGTFIRFGAVGAQEVFEDDDMFIIMAPQNAVGNCIIDDLKAMVEAAGDRPVIIINPRLKDLPASGGVMQIIGRDKRMEFVESFFTCYNFRLMYTSGTQYPIVGAFRFLMYIEGPIMAQFKIYENEFGTVNAMAYPGPYEIYKRYDLARGEEQYSPIASFDHAPTRGEISDAYSGRVSKVESPQTGIWGFFSSLLG